MATADRTVPATDPVPDARAASLPEAPVHPTLGDIEQLRSAREQYDTAAREVPGSTSDELPYDADEVVGGSTIGSLPELAFAHHAHRGQPRPAGGTASGSNDASACPCCDG
jgi:hypothetical protein